MALCKRTVTLVFSVAWCAVFHAGATSYNDIPLPSITDQTDLWVRGKVRSLETRELEESERGTFDSNGSHEIIIKIDVVNSSPKIDEMEVTVHWAALKERIARIQKNQECIAALIRRDDGTYKTLWQVGLYGWYQPDTGTSIVSQAGATLTNIRSNLLWELVTALRTGLDSPNGPAASTAEAWTPRLTSSSLSEFGAAQIVFEAFPSLPLPPETLIAALETQHANLLVRMANSAAPYDERDQYCRTFVLTLRLLMRNGDPDSIKGLMAVLQQDFTSEWCTFESRPDLAEQLVRVVSARGGDARVDLLKSILGRPFDWKSDDGTRSKHDTPIRADAGILRAIGDYEGGDLDALLIEILNNPTEFDIQDTLALSGLWYALAKRGHPIIKPYLEAYIANPSPEKLGILSNDPENRGVIYAKEVLQTYARNLPKSDQIQEFLRLYEQGDLGALHDALRLITKHDTAFVPSLAAIPIDVLTDSHYSLASSFSYMAATRLPDPAFLPQLRTLANGAPSGWVFQALRACGDEPLARKLALEAVEAPLPARDLRAVYLTIEERTGVVGFLGGLKDPELFENINRFTRPELLNKYRETLIGAAKAEGKEQYDFPVGMLERMAILALARTGGPKSIPRLKEIYLDGDIGDRIVAAMGLYAQGDDTGIELVRSFAEHHELENEEIAARWRVDLFGEFHRAARMLESPRVDAILLERIKRGMDESDHDVLPYYTFVEANKSAILQALVVNLESKKLRLREDAARMLQDITGMKSDYDPEKLPRDQEDAIMEWRSRVAAIVAKS